MNLLDKQYQDLLQDILDNGVKKDNRTGIGTLSIFGRQIRHKMSDGFPLITTKKMYFRGIVTELLWFLRGDTNIKYLIDNECHIWDGDCYKYFKSTFSQMPGIQSSLPSQKEFIEKIKTNDNYAKKWGDLGPIYGRQWRAWGGYERVPDGWTHGAPSHFKNKPILDQIQNLITELQTNPDSRRLMVTAWNPLEISKQVLPPCHYGFQVYTKKLSIKERIVEYEKRGYTKNIDPLDLVPERSISLMFNMRSSDTPLGLPFNLASYGLLLEIIAKVVNMVPDELIGNLGDTHIYLNQIDGVKEQLMREPHPLPILKIKKPDRFFQSLSQDLSLLNQLEIFDLEIFNYKSHPAIKIPLSN